MAASVYNSNKNFSTEYVNTLNVSLTVGGSNKVLYVFVASGALSPVVPSAVKWRGSSGTSLTQLSTLLSAGIYGKFSVWRLTNPESATDNVTVSWGSKQDETLVIAVAIQDVNQTTPEGTIATYEGISNTPNATANSNNNDLVLGGLYFLETEGTRHTITCTQTSLQEIEGDDTKYEGLAVSYTVANSSTTNMGYTISGNIVSEGGNSAVFAFNVNGLSGSASLITKSTALRFSHLLVR